MKCQSMVAEHPHAWSPAISLAGLTFALAPRVGRKSRNRKCPRQRFAFQYALSFADAVVTDKDGKVVTLGRRIHGARGW